VTASVQTHASSRDLPLLAGSLAVVAWGFGPLIVRGISASAPSIIVFRIGFAVPVMIAVAYLTGGRITFAVLRRALFPGVLFALSMMASFESYKATSIAVATLIPAVQPALVLFVAFRLFGERSAGRQIVLAIAALAGVFGVVLAAGNTSGTAMRGNLLAVVNLLLWTVYFVQVKRIRSTGVHSWSFIASVFTVAACVSIPWGLVVSHDLHAVGGRDWLMIALMIGGPGILGHGMMTWAQRHLDLTVASLLTLASPVISAGGAWIIYSESLRPLQMVFSAVVLVALGGIVVNARSGAASQTALSGPAE
jgi:drug/metabolite transporter (DMT)-like permease